MARILALAVVVVVGLMSGIHPTAPTVPEDDPSPAARSRFSAEFRTLSSHELALLGYPADHQGWTTAEPDRIVRHAELHDPNGPPPGLNPDQAKYRPLTPRELVQYGVPSTWRGWITFGVSRLDDLNGASAADLTFYADGWQNVKLHHEESHSFPLGSNGAYETASTHRYDGGGWRLSSTLGYLVLGSETSAGGMMARAYLEEGHGWPADAFVVVQRTFPGTPNVHVHELGWIDMLLLDVDPETCREHFLIERERVPNLHTAYDICAPLPAPHFVYVAPPDPWWKHLQSLVPDVPYCRQYVQETFPEGLPRDAPPDPCSLP